MTAISETAAPASRPEWWAWLRRELAPHPGRERLMWRMVISAVLVTIVSMTLQTPDTALSAYMAIFVCKENRKLTTIAAIGIVLGVTLGVGLTLFLSHFTFGRPDLQVPVMVLTLFGGMFLSRTFVIGPLGFALGFIIAVTQSMADFAPDGDILVREFLWAWSCYVYPTVLTVIVSLILPSGESKSSPHEHPKSRQHRGLFVADAFTNPIYTRFALKVTLAAMSCYIIYMGLDWPGIDTAFVTCCIIALESTAATIHKGWLRLSGCAVGGLLGFLSILYLVPHMETIFSLTLLAAAGSALAGWVAAGSPRIAYAGLQIALAFFMCIFQGFGPETKFTTIRDRLVGIVLGLVVSSTIFLYLWPERERESRPAP